MTPYGDSVRLKQELRDELYELDFKDQEVEQKRSQKWIGIFITGASGVYTLPVVENIIPGVYEPIPPSTYGAMAVAALGMAVWRRSAREQRKLECEAQEIAQPTYDLIRFMDTISVEFNLPELECSRYNLGVVGRYLPPKIQ